MVPGESLPFENCHVGATAHRLIALSREVGPTEWRRPGGATVKRLLARRLSQMNQLLAKGPL